MTRIICPLCGEEQDIKVNPYPDPEDPERDPKPEPDTCRCGAYFFFDYLPAKTGHYYSTVARTVRTLNGETFVYQGLYLVAQK